MSLALVVLHVFVCVFLIAVVLLQRGKGAEIGAVFGGGASTTVFGSRGAGNFLSRLTTLAAAIFMITSLGLAYLWAETSSDGLFTDAEAQQAPPVEAPIFEELGQAPAAEPGALPALPAPSPDAAPPIDAPTP
jgi:preprotein translocase subunit SecG